MLKVEHEHWKQSLSDLLGCAIHEEHPRVREHYFALYLLAQGKDAKELNVIEQTRCKDKQG
ncbi:hypothetical protein COW64_21660 [bacterium (Candidatus Blackallbacteria) CG18_big_fil_WC_8_21_14_2_50_49_26]|nr:MAG: hypothetical protein COW64_21660 [bacterium (Candidatus Blackallbacteria) CG18_big_fil_WC_8_21_14_2_50_49_26]